MVGTVEVETLPENKVEPSKPSSVPVQLPEVLSVRAPETFCSPEPKRELKDEPPMIKLVVEAVTKEA